MHCYGTAFYKEDLEKFLGLFSLLFSPVLFREPVVLCDTLTQKNVLNQAVPKNFKVILIDHFFSTREFENKFVWCK